MSEQDGPWFGNVDHWVKRAETAEARVAELEAALRRFTDPDNAPLMVMGDAHMARLVEGARTVLAKGEGGMSCNHDRWESEAAVYADGLCPLCLRGRVAELEAENADLRNALDFVKDERDHWHNVVPIHERVKYPFKPWEDAK